MKKCPKCKKQMADSSLYCDICGVELEKVKQRTTPKKKKQEEPEILEVTEILEPAEELSILEQHGKSFFESEPEIEKEQLEEEIKQENYKKEKLKEVYKLNTPTKKKPKKSTKKKEPETVPETEPEILQEEPIIEETEVIEEITEPETVPETEPETAPQTEPETVPQTEPEMLSEQQEIVEPPPLQPESNQVVEPVPETVPITEPVQKPAVIPIPMAPPQPNIVEEQVETPEQTTNKRITISIILSIVSAVLCFINPLAIVGFVLALTVKEKSRKKTIALILNGTSFAIGIIIVLLMVFGLITTKKEEIEPVDKNTAKFYGEGFSLSYSSIWKTTIMSEDITALQYNQEKSFLIPLGQSNLDITIDCDFTKQACKKTTYTEFLNHWMEDMSPDYIVSQDSSFVSLKEDIYYATYNYASSLTEKQIGKFYLIVSKSKNTVLSFQSQTELEDEIASLNSEIMEILNTIEIDDKSRKNSGSDEILEQLTSWSIFSDLRQDIEAKKPNIYGEFRMLSSENSYWVFNEKGEFWWYKSEYDQKDNYWYGKIKMKTGKKGMRLVGLKETKLDAIIKQANGKITSDDVYSMIMTPKQIISNGEDKSATNISSNMEWKFVWIIVDHGKEGIEAQVLNVDTSDTSYFVKVKDNS